MQFELSDDDIKKISSIVNNEDIKLRATYLKERDEFVEEFPSEFAEEIFDLVRHGIYAGVLYISAINPELIDELGGVLSTEEYEFEWPSEITLCPFIRDAQYQCYRCMRYSWETEMKKDNELICPKCMTISKPLGRRHRRTEKFRIIRKEELNG